MAEPVEVELPRDSSAPRAARHWLQESFGATLDGGEIDRAKLLVSELVTNALLHGHGTITLRAHADEDRLLVEVIDQGSGFERVVRDQDFDTVGGWGLTIVDAESSRWGVHEGTTHLWFEIERSGPRLGVEKNPAGEDGD